MRSILIVLLTCAFAASVLAAPVGVPVAAAGAPAALKPHSEAWAGEAEWRALERAGVKIASIEVVVHGVFPVTGQEQPWYERAANKLHIETEEPVILAHLLFKVGERVSARRIYETERRLRALPYVREAVIEAGARSAKGVVARVVIDDAWSLKLSASYDSAGGQVSSGFSIEDSNLFGSGKTLALSRSSDVVRDSTEIAYSDPTLFDTHWTLGMHFAKASDGASNGVRVALPFVRADSPWAFSAAFDVTNDELYYWNEGKEAYAVASERQVHAIEVGKLLQWRGDSGWRARVGVHSDYFVYAPPVAIDATLRPAPVLVDRVLNGMVLSLERFHDHYRSFKNLALVDRFEDYNLGFDATIEIGRFPAFAGSTVDSETVLIEADWAAHFGSADLLFVDTKYSTRHEAGVGEVDGYLSAIGTYYMRRFDPHTLVMRGQLELRAEPDPEHQLYLGGLDGLYGYPSYYKYGERRWTLHFEDRILTEKVLFNAFRVGYSAFFEAGQIQENDGTGPRWSKIYADIGGGYRIGSLRGAFGSVLYFMVAVPLVHDPGLPSYQVVIGNSIEF